MCRGPLSTAPRPSWRSTKAVWCQPFLYGYMTESDIIKLSVFHTKNLRRILQIFWPDTISNQQLLAHCNQDNMETIIMGRAMEMGTSWGKSRTTSLTQPFTGHLKESARGEDQETPGAELWRQSSRPCNTLGVPFKSCPGTDRRGDPSYPPYVPHGIMGMSKWVSDTFLGSIYLGVILYFFYTFLGSVYLRVIFNLFYTFLGSVYLRVIFNLFCTLFSTVYLRVTFNLFYTLLGSVYLRVTFTLLCTLLGSEYLKGYFQSPSYPFG